MNLQYSYCQFSNKILLINSQQNQHIFLMKKQQLSCKSLQNIQQNKQNAQREQFYQKNSINYDNHIPQCISRLKKQLTSQILQQQSQQSQINQQKQQYEKQYTSYKSSTLSNFNKNTENKNLQQQSIHHKSVHNQTQTSLHRKIKKIKTNKRLKTTSDILIYQENIGNSNKEEKQNEQFLHTFYHPTKQFLRSHKPFLQNKKIIFNIKNRQNNTNLNKDYKQFTQKGKHHNNKQRQSNIEKLKKQILQLDKQDFVSYRSKSYSNTDQIRIIQNEKINKYNHQNSLIVEWKGKSFYKPTVVRPNSTMTTNNNNNICTLANINSQNNVSMKKCQTPTGIVLNNFVSYTSFSSAPRKYFSKPKTKYVDKSQDMLICGDRRKNNSSIQNHINNQIRMKAEEIAIGLNMFRGKLHKKKVNSTYC